MNRNFTQKLIIFCFAILALVITIKAFNGASNEHIEIYLFTNPNNVGDRNQILGIEKELTNLLSTKPDSQEINVNTESELEAAISKINSNINNKIIVITSGDYGIDVITKLPISKNLITCHSSHQLTPNHEKILGVAKIIALPKHAVNENFKKKIEDTSTALVETTGVAHNLYKDELISEASKIQDIIPSNKKYMAVILGGDAPTPNGKMLYYTEKSAINLAQYLSEKIKSNDLYLLILNGPRTGKFNPMTGAVNAAAHKDGNIDNVTKAFIKTLKDAGLEEEKSFTLFDFQFGKPSEYKPVLGTILQNKGEIYVPGESTSMVSESIDNLPGTVTIYLHEGMNEVHQAHAKSEFEAGRANILDQDMNIKMVSKENETLITQSACQKIASKIRNLV